MARKPNDPVVFRLLPRQTCFELPLGYVADAMPQGTSWLLAISCTSAVIADGGGFAPFANEATARGLNYLVAPYGSTAAVLGSGLCAADLDGDGHTDVVAMGKASGIIGVFKNNGGMNFSAQVSGIAPIPAGAGVAAGDFDADGDLDLAFSQMGGPPLLYRQDGPFAFANVSTAAGLAGNDAGRSIAWFDADGDGWLDLLVACYTGYTSALSSSTTRLWRNQGDGTFINDTSAFGLGAPMRTFVATPFDFDHDGDSDLYFSNDRGHLAPAGQGNHLYRNDGGQFVDHSAECGADLGYYSMGVAVGDLDGNGMMDLLTTNLLTESQPIGAIIPLFIATAPGVFQESSVQWGIVGSVANETGWAAHFFDADNDRNLDLFLNNQTTLDRFFHQQEPNGMIERAGSVNLSGSSGVAFCSVLADFDGDGGIDLLSNHTSGNLRLMMNHEARLRKWVHLRVVGEGANRNAIGARLVVEAGGQAMERQVFAGGTGYLGMSDSRVHVGCGSAATVTVQVWWPSTGSSRLLSNLPTAAIWSIYPPGALGDGDFDGDADVQDLALFELCAETPTITAGCEPFDFDGNSQVNDADRVWLLARINHDRCDLNGDGLVTAADLGTLLAGWGTRGIGDIDGSGLVDASDLALLLASWD